ncbi:MAG: bifunctional aspartate kinase/homoserine dehydrogenase I [Rhodothermaceae bacterium]
MKVLKFGGSSVGNADRINQVIGILKKQYIEKGEHIAVVFSAFQGVTDLLITMSKKAVSRNESYKIDFDTFRMRHHEIIDGLIPKSKSKQVKLSVDELIKELQELLHGLFLIGERTKKTQDYIMSFGERLSCIVISEALNHKKIESEFLDSRKLIITDDCYGSARVDFDLTNKNIKNHFKKNKKIQIITGFIASNDAGQTTTLGRGGSDYTAAIYGAALKVSEIVIWTDVDGILTADPRKVKDSFPLKAVTYQEAMELSHFGAKVIHPPTIIPALLKKIKIRVKNTFNPDYKGTLILEREDDIEFNVKGISSIEEINMITVRGGGMVGVVGMTSRMLYALAKKDISAVLVSQGSSELALTIGVLPEDGKLAKKCIEEELKYEIRDGNVSEISLEKDLSVIAVVGDDMKITPGIFGKIFQALGKNGINVYTVAQGASELNTSIVIEKEQLKKALNVLHDSLFLSKVKTLNVFMVGPGLVGGTLLDLVARRLKYLEEELHIRFKLVGLANSKKMVFDQDGIVISDWREVLENTGTRMNSKKYVKTMKEMNLANTIFVDCTAIDLMVPHYKDILNSVISIVTPNKIANSLPYDQYSEIQRAAKQNEVEFRYETNVGAALPILITLKDLIANGDKIYKIEGVLSGTLSYLFNSLKEEDSFFEIVKRAKEMGYTEPDPRDDLNGLDMVRKLLILCRETGLEMNLEDIEVENLIPEKARKAKSIDSFFEKLKESDEEFLKQKQAAKENGKVLCYIAKYENGKAKVGVEEIGEEHPFYNLRGNDNIVAFTTKNYLDKPLMVRGPGAGAEVTASGVFTDILRISNYLSV